MQHNLEWQTIIQFSGVKLKGVQKEGKQTGVHVAKKQTRHGFLLYSVTLYCTVLLHCNVFMYSVTLSGLGGKNSLSDRAGQE